MAGRGSLARRTKPMSEHHTVRCDECGRTKTMQNRWFKLAETPASFILRPAESCLAAEGMDDLCSPFCARARLSRWTDALMLGGAV